MENLRINNPCPMLLSRMGKKDGAFFCNSCSKEVVDFRNMSKEEIRLKLNKNTCGVFNLEQLPGQRRMKVKSRFVFYSMILFSFFGLSVSPINAQNANEGFKKDTTQGECKVELTDKTSKPKKEESKRRRRRKAFFRKKVVFRTMGCPEF